MLFECMKGGIVPDQNADEKNAALRQRAEQKLDEQLSRAADFSLEDAKRSIHELHVHQIELELQNEELRSAQLALESSRRRYSDLYEFSPVGLLTLDSDARIQEANLTFVTLIGIEREKILKRYLSDFVESSAQDAYHHFYQALRTTQQPRQCEISLLLPSQQALMVRLDGTALVQGGSATAYRVAVSDVSVQYWSEQEIRRLFAAEQVARIEADRTALRLASLQHITAALARSLTYTQVSETCLQQSLPSIGAYQGVIYLLSIDGSTLHPRGAYGFAEDALPLLSLPVTAFALFMDVLDDESAVWMHSLTDYGERYPGALRLPGDDSQAFASLPLLVNEQPIGILNYGFVQPQAFTDEDQAFMQAVAQQCAGAFERVRLSDLAHELGAMQERARLARDLHDGVKQSLFAATLMSEALPRLWERDPDRARQQLTQVIALNRGALAEMQGLLLEMHPESILRTGLSSLMRQLIESVQGHSEISGELVLEGDEPSLPADVHIAFYRVAQESVNNISKHSRATQFTIQMFNEPDLLTLSIRDNGTGFDQAGSSAGMGMGTMHERAEAIHARLQITSSVGMGTEVKLLWKPVSPTSG